MDILQLLEWTLSSDANRVTFCLLYTGFPKRIFKNFLSRRPIGRFLPIRVPCALDVEKQEGPVVSDILPVFSGEREGGCFPGSMSPVEGQTIEFDHPQIFIPVDRKHSCY